MHAFILFFYVINYINGNRGKDVSPWNKNEGYTHVFECNFESMEGIAEYAAHPAHLEYAKSLLPYVEKYILFDYKLNTQAAAII